MEVKYILMTSVFILITLFAVVFASMGINPLYSFEVDMLCNENNTVLYRNGTEWGCSDEYTLVGFSAKNSLVTIPSASWTTVPFITELDDTGSNFDGTRFTVPAGKGGLYSVSGAFVFAQVTDGGIYIVGISVNDAVGVSYIMGRGSAGSTALQGVGGSLQIPLNAGDTIKLQAYSASATTGFNLDGYQSFSAYRING